MPARVRVLDLPYRIAGVGDLGFVEDTEGNRLGLMKYDREPEP